MGLPQQLERVYGDGIKGKLGNPRPYKIIENRAKLYYNGSVEEYLKDETIRKNIRDNANKKINFEKQNRHQVNSKEYKKGKSYLTISNEEAQKLIEEYSGTGFIVRDKNERFIGKEFIIANQNVGININLNTQEESITNRFYIHYSKTGTHIVPTNKGVDK